MFGRSQQEGIFSNSFMLAAYGCAIAAVWLLLVKVPSYIYVLYFESNAPGVLNIYIFYPLWALAYAVTNAFYMSVGLKSILFLKRVVLETWKQNTPPYWIQQDEKAHLPDTFENRFHNLHEKFQKFKKWALISVLIILFSSIIYAKVVMFNEDAIQSLLTDLLPHDTLILLSYIVSVPVVSIQNNYFAQSEFSQTLATIFISWIPTIPVVIAFLNIQSYIYEKLCFLLYPPIQRNLWR